MNRTGFNPATVKRVTHHVKNETQERDYNAFSVGYAAYQPNRQDVIMWGVDTYADALDAFEARAGKVGAFAAGVHDAGKIETFVVLYDIQGAQILKMIRIANY